MPGADLERAERDLYEALSAVNRSQDRLAKAYEDAIALCRSSPTAGAEVFELAELLGELSEAYEALGRPADALDAMRQAIDAGYRGQPDPRCRLAEIHLRSGNAEEAHRIFAEVREDTPDDVWLYNNAGLEYGHAGDQARALEWLDDGLELAMDTHDPERLVDQLVDLRQQSLDALGRDADDLQRRGRAFLAAPPPRPSHRHVPAAPSGTASPWPTRTAAVEPTPEPPSREAAVVLSATAWFPAEEWPGALAAWPEIADGVGTSDHGEYCRGIQRHLLRFSAAQRDSGVTSSLAVAPIRLPDYRAWCVERGQDPSEAGSRATYAADRARIKANDVVPWPPERNQQCWCGSGRKYKQCCGRVRLNPS